MSGELEKGPDFAAISPTAYVIAWLRAEAGVPLAGEVARALDASAVAQRVLEGSGQPMSVHLRNVPFTEARTGWVTHTLVRLGLNQVLELGAGLTFRGLALAADPELLYLDTDLPALQATKRRLLASAPQLRPAGTGRVLLRDLDVTDGPGFQALAAELDSARPLAVVHEGLLGYLDFREKAAVARSVGSLLLRHGGAWLTPDLATRPDYERHHRAFLGSREANATIARQTGRDFLDNAFEDDAHIEAFFAELGFDVEHRDQLDDQPPLRSLDRGGVSEAQVRAAGPRAFVLRLRQVC